MKKEIYIVTAGEYSDYHICGVFDNKGLALKLLDKIRHDYLPRIEIHKMNPFEQQLNKGYNRYFIKMAKDGQCIDMRQVDNSYIQNEICFDAYKNMYLDCFAKDEKHAIKIANEKRAELIALNRWK